jgi:membrane protein insertase Oxa1/YidC/SpoIIIJ
MPQPNRFSLLSRFDRYAWYFFFVWFAGVTLLQLVLHPNAALLGFWGVVLVLLTTVLRLALLGEEFRRRRRTRLCLASYGLVALLGVIVLVQLIMKKP